MCLSVNFPLFVSTTMTASLAKALGLTLPGSVALALGALAGPFDSTPFRTIALRDPPVWIYRIPRAQCLGCAWLGEFGAEATAPLDRRPRGEALAQSGRLPQAPGGIASINGARRLSPESSLGIREKIVSAAPGAR